MRLQPAQHSPHVKVSIQSMVLAAEPQPIHDALGVDELTEDMRVVLKVLVFGLYLGDHFSWFKGLAKVSRKKTRKDYTFFAKDL